MNKTRKLLNTIKERIWNMMVMSMRHGEKLLYIIMEGETSGKKDRERSRTSYIKNMISHAGLTNYKELKRLAGDRNKWRNYGKLQDQP